MFQSFNNLDFKMMLVLSSYIEGICTLFLFSLITYLLSILMTDLTSKKKDGKEEKEENMKIKKEKRTNASLINLI